MGSLVMMLQVDPEALKKILRVRSNNAGTSRQTVRERIRADCRVVPAV